MNTPAEWATLVGGLSLFLTVIVAIGSGVVNGRKRRGERSAQAFQLARLLRDLAKDPSSQVNSTQHESGIRSMEEAARFMSYQEHPSFTATRPRLACGGGAVRRRTVLHWPWFFACSRALFPTLPLTFGILGYIALVVAAAGYFWRWTSNRQLKRAIGRPGL